MDWQVKPAGRLSQVSGEAFSPGQKIISYLYKDEGDDLRRIDALAAEADRFTAPGPILGWWTQTVKDQEDKAEVRRRVIETSEELFLSLFEEGADSAQESETLKFLLAIMLERKRILRRCGKPDDGEPQLYRHSKSGQEFDVPQVDLTASSVLKIQEQLRVLI